MLTSPRRWTRSDEHNRNRDIRRNRVSDTDAINEREEGKDYAPSDRGSSLASYIVAMGVLLGIIVLVVRGAKALSSDRDGSRCERLMGQTANLSTGVYEFDARIAKVLTEDGAWRIACNIAKLPALLGKGP